VITKYHIFYVRSSEKSPNKKIVQTLLDLVKMLLQLFIRQIDAELLEAAKNMHLLELKKRNWQT